MNPAKSTEPEIFERWADMPKELVASFAKALGWTPATVRMNLRRLDARDAKRAAERYDKLAERIAERLAGIQGEKLNP